MITAVDTNILLDVLLEDDRFLEGSKKLLQDSYQQGSLIIAPEVYSELLTQFLREDGEQGEGKLEEFLFDLGIGVKGHGKDSISKAARSWLKYTRNKSQKGIACPHCGTNNEFRCKKCGNLVEWRQHIITDFMIGSNAEEHADRLLSRDKQFFKNYFDLEIRG